MWAYQRKHPAHRAEWRVNMTSKERAALRARANTLDAIFQIGKGGISENLIKQVDEALNVRELIKVRVLLETAPGAPKDLAFQLGEATASEVVQVIGGIIVLYRALPEKEKKAKTSKDTKAPKKGKVVRGLRKRNGDREAFFEKKRAAGGGRKFSAGKGTGKGPGENRR